MKKIINPKWQSNRQAEIFAGQQIDQVITFNEAAKWLIAELERAGYNYTVKNCGAGVKRITGIK